MDFKKALEKFGYEEMEPTEDSVRTLFSDLIDTGGWSNVEPEDVDDTPIEDIYYNIMRRKR